MSRNIFPTQSDAELAVAHLKRAEAEFHESNAKLASMHLHDPDVQTIIELEHGQKAKAFRFAQLDPHLPPI